MKQFAAIVILSLFTTNLQALEKRGVQIGIFDLYPSLAYGHLFKKENRSELTHFDYIAGELFLNEGKRKLLLDQTLKGVYTIDRANPFDYYTGFGATFNTSNKLIIKANIAKEELQNHIDAVWFEENKTKKNSFSFESLYDSNSSLKASAKYSFEKAETKIRLSAIEKSSHTCDFLLEHERAKTITNKFSISFDESINNTLDQTKKITEFNDILSISPILRSLIGIGYKHVSTNYNRIEKTPFIRLSKELGHKTIFDSAFGKTFTNDNDESLYVKLELEYTNSVKSSMRIWYDYGFLKDPTLQTSKTYTAGLSLNRKNNDDLNIEVQAYTSTIIDNSKTESERKYFIESDIKYSLTRNFALALNYNWSCEVQLGKISLVGFL